MTEQKPRILITGATGQVGRGVVERLKRDTSIEVIAATRSSAKADDIGVEAVRLDLDKVETIAPALEGVERLFILTGYTVDMLRQSKSLIDAARKSGVKYIVHLGACGNDESDVDHYGWHQFVERYIEWSGIPFTHLRPEVFLQNLLGYSGIKTVREGVIRHYVGHAKQVWVDADDVAEVAAECLANPGRHSGETYRLGYDLKSQDEIAEIMAKVFNKPFHYEPRPPQEFLDNALAGGADPAYMNCVFNSFERLGNGGIPDSEEVFGNFQRLVGKAPTSVEDFVRKHAAAFDY